jgi:hypothetical protein
MLLPVIAAAIYVEGQKYDPATIDFKSQAGAGASNPAQSIPSDIAGCVRSGPVRSFTTENLYEYVDGHAEFFISAGFAGLWVMDYAKAARNSPNPKSGVRPPASMEVRPPASLAVQPTASTAAAAPASDVVVELYDMGGDIQAFGVLVDEAGEGTEPFEAGAMGFKTPQGISFFKGRWYVKVSVFSAEVQAVEFARIVDKAIIAQAGKFVLFEKLPVVGPDIGKVTATRFIKNSYRGLSFMKNVIEREYSIKGKTAQVAMVSGEGVKKLIQDMDAFLAKSGVKRSDAGVTPTGDRISMVPDPYEGNWYMIISGGADGRGDRGSDREGDITFYGVYGEAAPDILKAFKKSTVARPLRQVVAQPSRQTAASPMTPRAKPSTMPGVAPPIYAGGRTPIDAGGRTS